MNYALIENGIVVNVIWLYKGNAKDFPNAVKIGDRPVAIGDSYDGEAFYHEGVKVLSAAEQLAEYEAALTEIEEALGV